MEQEEKKKLISLIFMAIGLIWFVAAIRILFNDALNRVQCKEKVQATVIENERQYAKGIKLKSSTEKYRTVYQFKVGNREYTVKSSYPAPLEENHSVGEKVELHYNPDNPKQIYEKSPGSSMVVSIICRIVMGIIFLFLGYRNWISENGIIRLKNRR